MRVPILLTLFVTIALPVTALPPVDAEIVLVRKDCAASALPAACVSAMADVNTWLPTRVPAQNPVLIDVGPGDWLEFHCNGQSNMTVRGSGRDTTRIIKTSGALAGAMDFVSCANVAVESLTVHGSFVGVMWKGSGSSTWSNTDILAGGIGFETESIFSIGWYDSAPDCLNPPLHYFFGSRTTGLGAGNFNYGFLARCSEHWFFGGEIMATHEAEFAGGSWQGAAVVDHGGDLRVFGTAIRSNPGTTTNTALRPPLPGVGSGAAGVAVLTDGEFHAHGAIVNSSSNTSDLANNVQGMVVASGAIRGHTPGTAFVVNAGPGGTSTRVSGPANLVQSPFLWQQLTEPPRSDPSNPLSAFVASIQGADLFVETDCNATHCSEIVNPQPHLMVYSASCTGPGGNWFDTVTGLCRVP